MQSLLNDSDVRLSMLCTLSTLLFACRFPKKSAGYFVQLNTFPIKNSTCRGIEDCSVHGSAALPGCRTYTLLPNNRSALLHQDSLRFPLSEIHDKNWIYNRQRNVDHITDSFDISSKSQAMLRKAGESSALKQFMEGTCSFTYLRIQKHNREHSIIVEYLML